MSIPSEHDEDPGFKIDDAIASISMALARGESFAEYSARALVDTDYLLPPPPFGNLREDPALRRSLALALVRALWRQMPNPANRFAPDALPNPERNAPCHCGSGHKYKKCCEPIERDVPNQPMNLLPDLLDALPKKRWGELVGSRISLELVGHTAYEWTRVGRDKEAAQLLEPWYTDDSHFEARHELMIDALLDAYTNLDKPRKKAQLLVRAQTHGDRTIRSAAMQRQVSMHADLNEFEDAWRLFAEAQRTNPDAPSLSHLEVTVLLSEGRESEARERARFWVMRLQRQGDPDLVDLITMLQDVAENGGEGMLNIAAEMKPGVDQFVAALRAAPTVASAYELDPVNDSAGPLTPSPELDSALAEWLAAFPDPQGFEGDDADAIWVYAADWLAVLEAQPILWQCFDVINSLCHAAVAIAVPGTDHLLDELFERAEALLHEVIRENSAGGFKLEWGWMQNRTALRLLGSRIQRDLDSPVTTSNLARLEWLVRTLNPNDNQGFRNPLLRRYMEAGQLGDALELADQYPDDFATTRYNRALTLFALGETGRATTALRDAIAEYPKPLAWLLKPNPKPPKQDTYGIAIGGDEEAWIYRCEHLHLWVQFEALDWARQISKKIRK